MTHLVQTLHFIPNAISKILDWFDGISFEMNRSRKISETIKELSKLTDKELKDIGITRGDIHSIAMETHYDNRKDS